MRARDHGIVIGRVPPGAANAITDVAGVLVGHASPAPEQTGVTVVVPRADAWLEPAPAGTAVLNGAGELTGSLQIREWGCIETPIFLTGTPYVGAVYEAATRVLTERQPLIGVDDVIIPVVGECDPSAVVDVVGGARPDVALVAAALDGARSGTVAEGQVGAGIGMHCCDFAGGIGTASRLVGGYTVGVLLLVNFGDWEELRIGGRLAGVPAPTRGVDGSCIAVVATDAPLVASDLERLARRAFLGLARAGSYASHGSGEIAVAFTTANAALHARATEHPVVQIGVLRDPAALSALFAGCVEAAEEAVLNALLGARTLHGARGTAHAFPADRLSQ